jgi:CheY-like chemotaxis protein
MGLGLSITKKLIEMMGGTLQVNSQLNKGSTFEFKIALPINLEWIDSTELQMSTIIGYEGVHRTILIVDDFSENRSLLADMLTPLGFSVAQANNGLEGLEKLQKMVPDLILADLVMPRMDGFEFIRQVRQISIYQTIPIIATSISAFETQFLQEDIPGCNAYLTKPWYKEDLLKILGEKLDLIYIYKQKQMATIQLTEEINDMPEESDRLPVVGPSAKEAARLLDLALKGDYRGITQFTDKLVETNLKLKPFLEKVNFYAKQFDDESICELIRPYLVTQ